MVGRFKEVAPGDEEMKEMPPKPTALPISCYKLRVTSYKLLINQNIT